MRSQTCIYSNSIVNTKEVQINILKKVGEKKPRSSAQPSHEANKTVVYLETDFQLDG